MSRTLHRTPRHLDDPVRLGPLTLGQWAVAAVAVLLFGALALRLPLPTPLWRIVLFAVPLGVTIGLTGDGRGDALTAIPRRLWHALTAPREYASGPPRHSPTWLALYDGRLPEEDLPDA